MAAPSTRRPNRSRTSSATSPPHCDAVAYILDTFPGIRREDEANHGEYRTKRAIVEIYDATQASTATGAPYQTRLDPPPTDINRVERHPNFRPKAMSISTHRIHTNAPLLLQ